VVVTGSVWGDPIRRFVILSVVFSFFSLFVGANLARAAAHSAKPPGPRSGSVNFATAAGKRATFSFTGTQAAWVSTIASNHGSATASLDGSAAATVNTHGTATKPCHDRLNGP
jgi:hypothetical protein